MVTKRSAKWRVTATCPGWLLPDGDRYKVDKGRAAMVYRAFKLAIEGQSLEAIAAEFNLDLLPLVRLGRRGGGDDELWTKTTVAFLLKNRDVLGNKAKGYPGIISEHNFEMVQKALAARRAGGRDVKNLFAGLLVCDVCGAALRFRDTYAVCPRKHAKQSFTVLEAMVGEALWGNMMHFKIPRKVDASTARASNAAYLRRHVKQIRITSSHLTITRVDGEVIETRGREPVPEEILRLIPNAADWW